MSKAQTERIKKMESYLDEAGVDIVLVGDSLANVALGYNSTQSVGMTEMLIFIGAVARGVNRALVIGDMPFMSYNISIEDALKNAGDMLRTLARFGINTMGTRIVGSLEVARTALIRSGVSVRERFLPGREESSLVFSFIREIPYFASASYKDAEMLAQALSDARRLIAKNEEAEIARILKEGEFSDKNDALISAYGRYMSLLAEKGLTDSISVIRKAISV